tara:strand:- start:1069 stop:1263 length:195 start_codon:yes stop_codon:yes gene_type:complete
MKKAIEDKIKKLKENQATLVKSINEGSRMLEKAKADLSAVNGAIVVCEQLLNEGEEKKEDGTKN